MAELGLSGTVGRGSLESHPRGACLGPAKTHALYKVGLVLCLYSSHTCILQGARSCALPLLWSACPCHALCALCTPVSYACWPLNCPQPLPPLLLLPLST